jgi:hypothetical protein
MMEGLSSWMRGALRFASTITKGSSSRDLAEEEVDLESFSSLSSFPVSMPILF